MAPMANFKQILNCHNSSCAQERVVIFDHMGDFRGRPI